MTSIQQHGHDDDVPDEHREWKQPVSDRSRIRNDRPRRLPRILPRLLPRLLLGVFLALWLAAFVPAAGMLLRYEWTPGAIAEAPRTLLQAAALSTSDQSPAFDAKAGLLIVAIHPRCTCTRATLEELEQAAPSWKQPFHAIFLIDQPAPQTASQTTSQTANPTSQQLRFDWHQSAILREAQSALHAEVLDDEEGKQAARLGALTSGEVLYYSTPNPRGDRRLLFSGGVTAGRGMAGENGGLDALKEVVQRSADQPSAPESDRSVRHTPVYGCGLAALAALNPVHNPVHNPASNGPPRELAR